MTSQEIKKALAKAVAGTKPADYKVSHKSSGYSDVYYIRIKHAHINIKSTLVLLSPEDIAENADTIEEVVNILQVLSEHNPADIITLFYADGLNCFEILDN